MKRAGRREGGWQEEKAWIMRQTHKGRLNWNRLSCCAAAAAEAFPINPAWSRSWRDFCQSIRMKCCTPPPVAWPSLVASSANLKLCARWCNQRERNKTESGSGTGCRPSKGHRWSHRKPGRECRERGKGSGLGSGWHKGTGIDKEWKASRIAVRWLYNKLSGEEREEVGGEGRGEVSWCDYIRAQVLVKVTEARPARDGPNLHTNEMQISFDFIATACHAGTSTTPARISKLPQRQASASASAGSWQRPRQCILHLQLSK